MKSVTATTTFFIALGMLLISHSGFSQTESLSGATEFTPAIATLDNYKALYIINSSDDRRVKGALRNIANAINDPRLKGKLQIELVVFSDGVEIFKRGSA